MGGNGGAIDRAGRHGPVVTGNGLPGAPGVTGMARDIDVADFGGVPVAINHHRPLVGQRCVGLATVAGTAVQLPFPRFLAVIAKHGGSQGHRLIEAGGFLMLAVIMSPRSGGLTSIEPGDGQFIRRPRP